MTEEKKDKYDEGEYDQEGDMAKSDLRSIMANAKELHDMIDDADNLPEWCQNKITLAEDYISTVANYLTAEMSEGVIQSKEKTVTVKHKTSGKELVVTAQKAKELKQQDYHPVKEEVSKADVPAYLRKQKGEKPLTMSDVKAPRKDSISAKENLAKARNEEVEQIDEEDAYEKDRYAVKNGKAVKDNPTHQGSPNYKDQPHHVYATSAENALKKHTKKEEVDQIDEMEIVKTATGMRVYGSSYGDSAKARRDQVKRPVDDVKGPKMKELSDIEAEKKKKKKKKMSEMVALYQEQGLKGLFASLVKEEPDNEQFTKELEAQKAKNAGEGKKAEVAKAAVQAVQEEEFEVVMNEPNGYAEATIEERSMTEPEIKKKEQIVKSMKKGISGFKARYGDDAKNVMYATATKRAMGEEVEQIEEGTPEGYQRRDGKLIPKIHPTMTPHEHGYDYTMQSIEDAPSKAKIHSQHKEIVKDNPHPQGSKEHKDWEAGTNKAKADHLKDWS